MSVMEYRQTSKRTSPLRTNPAEAGSEKGSPKQFEKLYPRFAMNGQEVSGCVSLIPGRGFDLTGTRLMP
jgi:hypothetical protein